MVPAFLDLGLLAALYVMLESNLLFVGLNEF